MSQKSGVESSKQSNLIVDLLAFIGVNLSTDLADIATFIIRKTAHFTEYFILFIFIYNVITIYISKRRCIIYTLALVFLYAGTDELHQYFIPGRSAAFRDVLIDTSGGLFAAMIDCIIRKIRTRLNR